MSIVPAMHIRIRIILAGWLLALQIGVVEYLGWVGSRLAFLQGSWHDGGAMSKGIEYWSVSRGVVKEEDMTFELGPLYQPEIRHS
jgi:hypothetical protein